MVRALGTHGTNEYHVYASLRYVGLRRAVWVTAKVGCWVVQQQQATTMVYRPNEGNATILAVESLGEAVTLGATEGENYFSSKITA